MNRKIYIFWPGYGGETHLTTRTTDDDEYARTRNVTPATYNRFAAIANSGKYPVSLGEHSLLDAISWHMAVPVREERRGESPQ